MILNRINMQSLKVDFVRHISIKDKKHPHIAEMKDYLESFKRTKIPPMLSAPLKLLFLRWIAKNNKQHPHIIFLEQYIESHEENLLGINPETYFTSAKEFAPEVLEFLKDLKEI